MGVCVVCLWSSKKNSWQDRGPSSLCLSLAACIQCVADLGVLWLFTADSLHVVIIAQNTAGMDCFPKSLVHSTCISATSITLATGYLTHQIQTGIYYL